MYPERELTRLALRKAALRRTIALNRTQLIGAVAGVARPLAWIDRLAGFTRRYAPFAILAAIPFSLVARRTVLPGAKLIGSLLRWTPLLLGVVRTLRHGAMRPARPGSP